MDFEPLLKLERRPCFTKFVSGGLQVHPLQESGPEPLVHRDCGLKHAVRYLGVQQPFRDFRVLRGYFTSAFKVPFSTRISSGSPGET